MKVEQTVPKCPEPEIAITLSRKEAVALNDQLGNLEDKYTDPTRQLFLMLDLTLNKVRNGG